MTKDEALKLALEALKQIDEAMPFPVAKLAQAAIKEALAQPKPWEKFCDSNCVWTDHHPDCKLAQQEPVAYLCENAVGHKYFRWKKPSSIYKPVALYTRGQA